MLLYRALNSEDLKEYYSNLKSIQCSYKRNFPNLFEILFESNESYSNIKYYMDSIIGHINETTLDTSPWISTSKDLDTVIRKYAIKENENNNYERKPIAIINIDRKDIYGHVDTIKNFILSSKENKTTPPFCINTEKNVLQKCFKEKLAKDGEHIIDRMSDNKHSKNKTIKMANHIHDIIFTRNINSISNKASDEHEVLVSKEIDKKKIIFIISPLLQDIMYATFYSEDFDIIKINAAIKKAYEKFSTTEKNIFNFLYGQLDCTYNPNIKYHSLTDLIDSYITIDIENQYNEILLSIYEEMMRKIVTMLNHKDLKGNVYDTIHVLNEKKFNYYEKDIKIFILE